MPNYRPHATPYHAYRQAPSTLPACKRDNWNDSPLAMAYVPWQTWREIYDVDKAFRCGTIFQELNLPFVGKRGNMR